MLQHQFKARSYNAGSIGIGREGAVFKPRHSDKPPTQQAPFRLSTDARATKSFPRQAEWRVMMLSKILLLIILNTVGRKIICGKPKD